MQEAPVWSLGWEDPLEEGMAAHSSILVWRIPRDRGAGQAAVHGVAESRTRLSDWAQHSDCCVPPFFPFLNKRVYCGQPIPAPSLRWGDRGCIMTCLWVKKVYIQKWCRNFTVLQDFNMIGRNSWAIFLEERINKSSTQKGRKLISVIKRQDCGRLYYCSLFTIPILGRGCISLPINS